MTDQMAAGPQAGTDRRRRVQDAILRDGTPLTASAIAQAARVDRTFLYRHRDLLEKLHASSTRSVDTGPRTSLTVTTTSLHADLANANAQCQTPCRPGPAAGSTSVPAARGKGVAGIRARRAGRHRRADAARAANRVTRALNQRG